MEEIGNTKNINLNIVVFNNNFIRISLDTMLAKLIFSIKNPNSTYINSENFVSTESELMAIIDKIKDGTLVEFEDATYEIESLKIFDIVDYLYYKKDFSKELENKETKDITEKYIKEKLPTITKKDDIYFLDNLETPLGVIYELIQYKASRNIRAYRMYLNCWENYHNLLNNKKNRRQFDFLIKLISFCHHIPSNNGFCFVANQAALEQQEKTVIYKANLTRKQNLHNNSLYETILYKSNLLDFSKFFYTEYSYTDVNIPLSSLYLKRKKSLCFDTFLITSKLSLFSIEPSTLVYLSFDLQFKTVPEIYFSELIALIRIKYLIF